MIECGESGGVIIHIDDHSLMPNHVRMVHYCGVMRRFEAVE